MNRLNHWIVLGSFAVITASCMRQPPIIDNQPPRYPSQAELRDSVVPTWSLTKLFTSGQLTYDYHSTTTVQALSDSIPRTDSIRTTAVLLTTFQELSARQSIRVTSRIDSVLVQTLPANTQVSSTNTQIGNPWPIEERNLELNRVTGRVGQHINVSVCTQDGRESLLRGDEVIPTIPIQAVSQQQWADTSVQQLCRGGVLLRITQVARYRIELGIDSGDSRLIRLTESQLSGVGTQWQQPVKADGQAIATDTFFISPVSNRIQQIAGYTRSEIAFQSARRNQQFLQITATSIQLRK